MTQAASATDSPADWTTLATGRPGPATLTALTDTNPGTLPPKDLLDAITCTERLLSHLAGLQTTLLTEFARPGRAGDITRIVNTLTNLGSPAHPTDDTLNTDLLHALVTDHAHGMAAAEIAAALHISPITARSRVEKAIDLHDGLPATHQALTDGLIDRGRAAVIAEHTDILDPDTRTQVEHLILPLAHNRTAGRLRPLIDRAVIIADPDAADRRVTKARRTREVTHRPLKEQLSLIKAILPADGAVTVFTLIDLLAGKKTTGDDRIIGERRADALTDLCHELLTHGQIDLRGLLTPTQDDDPDNPDDPDPDLDLDGLETNDDPDDDDPGDNDPGDDDPGQTVNDPATNRNGPVTSNCDWPDTDRANSDGWPGNDDRSGTQDRPDNDEDTVSKDEPGDTTRDSTDKDIDVAGQDTGKRIGTRAGTNCETAPASHTISHLDVNNPAENGTTGSATDPAEPSRQFAIDTSTSPKPAGNPPPAQPAPTREPPAPPARPDSRQLLRRQGRRPHLTLTMSMSTLMALDRLPGHLDGYGAITAELATAITNCAASLNLLIIDPNTGHPLHATGREYYRPRQHHRDIAATITETCRFPSCRQPAWKCDLDHRAPFNHQHPDHGGPTDPCNLDPLCRRHHLTKHHSTWTPSRQPDGTMQWQSPTGHTYNDPPREVTLPGELLTPTPTPRTSIGTADTEHRTRCGAPSTTPTAAMTTEEDAEQATQDALTRSHTIQTADREHTHQRVLQRLANLRRQQNAAKDLDSSAGTADVGPDANNDDHPAWTTANIPTTVAELRARSGLTTPIDDDPPF